MSSTTGRRAEPAAISTRAGQATTFPDAGPTLAAAWSDTDLMTQSCSEQTRIDPARRFEASLPEQPGVALASTGGSPGSAPHVIGDVTLLGLGAAFAPRPHRA